MNAKPRGDWALLLFLALLLAACRAVGSVVLPVYDDAFITLRYARNLATGHGFVYHPGEWVLGTTSPLFGLLCAAEHALGLPMPGTVVALNVLLDVAVLLLTVAALPRERRALWATAFAFLFSVSPIMTRVCVGGMEMNLYLVASLGAMALFQRRRTLAAVLLAALACFLRPEGVLLLGILLALVALRHGPRAFLRSAAAAAIALAPPLALLQVLYGSPLPQSLRAKYGADFVHPSSWQVMQRLLAPDALMAVCLPLAAWGAYGAARRPDAGPARVVGVWALGTVAAYSLARPNIWSWYGEPVYFAVLVFAAIGAADLALRIAPLRDRPAVSPALPRLLPAVAALPLAIWLGVWLHQGPSGVTRHVFEPLAAWCRTHDAARASFAAGDIGALGYFSNGRIYDRAGLVWPEAQQYRTDAEAIAKYLPDYLFLNATQGTREMIERSPWGRSYRPVARFSKTGAQDVRLADAPPGNVWVQDYVLYERVRGPAERERGPRAAR